MKIKHLFTAAALAIATIAAPVAHAVNFSANPGDLLLGFRQGGTTSNSDYVINIGNSATIFRDALGPVTISLSAVDSALSSKFGNGWLTDATVSWGLFATVGVDAANGDAYGNVYFTKAYGDTAPSQAPDQSNVFGAINSLANYYKSRPLVATGTNAAYGVLKGGAPNFTVQTNTFNQRVSTSFASPSNIGLITTSVTSAAGLELYRLPQIGDGAVSDEGNFALSGTGATTTLTFTPTTAVPEPSTYAFMFFGTMGFAFIAVRYFRSVRA